ncbi:tectonic-3 isoform X1 [Nothobranchius furzeri]|uniref:Transcript variant X1 n=2 Tax=Nothobranchius furzeri TaxID=105023 RepID=A0A8C6NQU8_NOTFU|nr:transcript variant X1 [Nothobranchius furzeri]KAF7204460.1 transcript variant X2 [Nothobranchius furzeri]
MTRFWCLFWLHVYIASYGGVGARAAADQGTAGAVDTPPTIGGPFSSATSAPGGSGVTEQATRPPALDSMITTTPDSMVTNTQDSLVTAPRDSMVTNTQDSLVTAPRDSMVTTNPSITEAPSPTTTVQTVISGEGCLCDLTPDFCDIGCCCDTADCDAANLTAIFTGCSPAVIRSEVCVEKWLMFRANVDSSLVTVTDTMFCVRSKAAAPQSLPSLHESPALGDSYHFSPSGHMFIRHSRHFYRADDVIQTFFSNSSVRGLLRQPSAGAASAFCFNRNPARFLRSSLLTCTRMVTPQSCTTDSSLSAHSYTSPMSLIKIPINETVTPSDFLIPVIPLGQWPAPVKMNNSCLNVVEKVEFTIGFTSRGELSNASVSVVLTDRTLHQQLLQTHSVQFQLTTPSPTPARATPAVGYRVGSLVFGHFEGEVKPVTTLGPSQGGECSPVPRSAVLFTHNTISGCTFISLARNCTELRSRIYEILQGPAAPDMMAMNSGSQPDWTRVIRRECPISPQETCDSGCVLPLSLSVQVLWARQGFTDVPQSYILGAKFLFHCQKVKCPSTFPLALTTRVVFVETTVYPEVPRGSPQPHA